MNLLNTATKLFFKLRQPSVKPDREVAILLADLSRNPIQLTPRHRFGRHRHQSDLHKPIYSGELNPPEL